jgi:hypothetical protein
MTTDFEHQKSKPDDGSGLLEKTRLNCCPIELKRVSCHSTEAEDCQPCTLPSSPSRVHFSFHKSDGDDEVKIKDIEAKFGRAIDMIKCNFRREDEV